MNGEVFVRFLSPPPPHTHTLGILFLIVRFNVSTPRPHHVKVMIYLFSRWNSVAPKTCDE